MKRPLSAMLSLLLAFSLVPAPALAEAANELDAVVSAVEEPGDATGDLETMDQTVEDGQASTDADDDIALQPQASMPFDMTIKTWSEEFGYWDGNRILNPLANYHIRAYDSVNSDEYEWQSAIDTITFTPVPDANASYRPGHTGPFAVRLNADRSSLDGLFYEEDGMLLPLPAGTYTITFTGEGGATYTTGSDSSYDYYQINEGDGFAFVAKYEAEASGDLARDSLHAYVHGTTVECDLVNLDEPVDLLLGTPTATTLGDSVQIGSLNKMNAQLVMYKAQDSSGNALSIDQLSARYAQDNLEGWPAQAWFDASSTVAHPVTAVWQRTSQTAGTNGTTWSFTKTGDKTGAFAINNIALGTRMGTESPLEEGVYFPVLRVSIDGLLYYYAYNPIEVAHVVVQRQTPTITTDVLPTAMRGIPYAMQLGGRTGVPAEGESAATGTFSWAVSSGSLPKGLELNAETGAISGTPTAGATTKSFTVTLTETFDGEAMQSSRDYTIAVLGTVALGKVSYSTDTIWTRDAPTDAVPLENHKLHLSVPISADIRSEEFGLSQSRVFYVVKQTSTGGTTRSWGEDVALGTCVSNDGKSLELDGVIQADTATIDSIEVTLYLYGDDGEPVLGPSEDGQSEGEPMKVSAKVENPQVHIGGWAEFYGLDFGTDESPTDMGRVTVWPYNGTTHPSGNVQVEEIDDSSSALFRLAPGEYAFTLEGAAYLKDEEGNPIWDEESEDYLYSWVDIMKSSSVARAIAGTHPKQFVFSVSPNQCTMVDHKLSTSNYDFHTAHPLFQTPDGTSYEANLADYEVSWYRYDASRVGKEYVLVGKGDTVSLEASDQDLYVEVTPTGRDAAFWKSSGKQKVATGAKACTVKVNRKPLFTATLHLSNRENRKPADGETWGIIEVSTPLESGGWASSSTWAYDSTVEVPNVTSGSVITYTPPVSLLAGQVEYEVPQDAESDIEVNLQAPLPAGLVTFENLTYLRADDTSTPDDDDAADRTVGFSLDDGRTTVEVTYFDSMYGQQSVPFYLADGTRIVIQHQNPTYFRVGGTYTVTLRHYEEARTDSIGASDKDYVAHQSYDIVLDDNLQATASLQITQPGSVVVPLLNPGNVGCELLLYGPDGNLVESGSAGGRTKVSTPLLDAGSYTLFAVDGNWSPTNESDYLHKSHLESYLANLKARATEQDVQLDYATSTDLTVEAGKKVVLGEEDGLTFPQWNATELIRKDESSVKAVPEYGERLTISMHAELLDGVQVSEDAYLQVITNQKTEEGALGYTAPRALNINGVGVAINRWSDLFQNQNMVDGSLRIMLAEAAKTNEKCRDFPMDLTLVVPRVDATKTEVAIWLVSDAGQRRSLIGSYSEVFSDVSISAPKAVAWSTFWVHGQTQPGAEVVIYTNGMRSSRTQADSYGYYTAEVALPPGVEEFDEFTVSATAQWTGENGKGGAAASKTESVTYTTLYPVIERITMCYQPGEDSEYAAVESYYRGKQSAKYRSVYRAIYSASQNDRGKVFWLVEFDNNNVANDVYAKDVRVNIPRSNGTTTILTSDSLEDVASWIKDVREESSDAGKLVRNALLRTGAGKRAFVSRPVSPSASPDQITVTFDVNEATSWQPFGTRALRRYEGYKNASHEELTAFLEALSAGGHLYTCSTAAECDGTPAPASTRAANLISAPEGTVDQWLMVSNEEEGDAKAWVQVHHQVRTEDLSALQIRMELARILATAHTVTTDYERWYESEGKDKTQGTNTYDGANVVFAISSKHTLYSSDDYLIATEDAHGDFAVDRMSVHAIEGTDACVYQRLRFDRRQFSCVTWNEDTGQKQELIYTIADDCLSEPGACGYDGEPGLGYYDLLYQWAGFQASLYASLNEAANTLFGGVGDLLTQSTSGESPTAEDDDTLLTQGGPTGVVKGKAENTLVGAVRKKLGIKDETEIANEVTAAQHNSQIKELGDNYINKYSIEGDQLSRLRDAWLAGKDYLEAKAFDLVNTVRSADPSSVIDPWSYVAWDLLVDPANDIIRKAKRWYNKTFEYQYYKQQKKLELVGLPNYLNYYRYKAPKALVNDFAWRLKEDEDWLKFVDAHNARMKIDPSGIVYEAVLSNPVEGATVKLYTYDVTDGVARFSDTQTYNGEDNPQITRADGRYQWFVPEGFWQVRVSKQGYENFSTGDEGYAEQRVVRDPQTQEVQLDAEGNPLTTTVWVGAYGIDATNDMDGDGVDDGKGYWMPVLPVQLEVNIPLVSKVAPRIESVVSDETGATVVFSKYMKVDTIAASMFTLNDAEPTSLVAVDAEAAGDGSGVMLARSFRLTYADGACVDPGTAVTVRFVDGDEDGAALSYAGVRMDDQYRTYEQTVSALESRVNILGAKVSLSSTKVEYTGSALKPSVTAVVVDDVTLVAGVDYEVSSYANNVNPGKATITLVGMGNYKGNATATFQITCPVSKLTVTAPAAQTYTGKALAPAPTVKRGSVALTRGTDYTLAYANNTNAGTATVTVRGAGNYTGTKSVSFVIKPAASKISLAAQERTYTGKALAYTGKVTRSGSAGAVTYRYYGDAKCAKAVAAAGIKDAGTYYVRATVAAKGNYAAATSAAAKLTIRPAASKISLAAQERTYTGKALAYTGKVTRSGSSGAVTYRYYSDAKCAKAVAAAGVKDAGTYYVRATVAAKGNYAAATSAVAKLTIRPAASKISLAAQERTYTGKALAYTGKVTRSGSSGAVTYRYYGDAKCAKAVAAASVKAAGTYYVRATVAARGNYAAATSAAAKLVVAKAANPLAARAVARTASAKTLRGKAVAVAAPLSVSGAKGRLSYAKASGPAALSVAGATGKVTVAKGTKAGRYTIKVKVSAAGDANHKAGSKTVSCTVTVK